MRFHLFESDVTILVFLFFFQDGIVSIVYAVFWLVAGVVNIAFAARFSNGVLGAAAVS